MGFRKHFRKTNNKKNKKHPALIYAKVGDEYVFLGLTHSKITKGVENIELEKNPNPKDSRESYVRPKADKINKSKVGKRLEDWTLSSADKHTVDKLIEKNKKKTDKDKKK